MRNPDGSLTCCDKKAGNCPVAEVTRDESGKPTGFVIEGDDGQRVPFTIAQFEILLDEGPELLEEIGL